MEEWTVGPLRAKFTPIGTTIRVPPKETFDETFAEI